VRTIGLITIICSATLLQSPVFAQAASAPDVKAAFLLNFATYVDWGNDARPDFAICVLGDEEVARSAQRLEGRLVHDKKVNVVRAVEGAALASCRMAFVGRASLGALAKIVDAAAHNRLLTVGSAEGLAKKGVMINIIDVDDTLGFEVNLTAARNAQLDISSRLLRLAKNVY
jgi:hypothetical protein